MLQANRGREHAHAQQILLPTTETISTSAVQLGLPDGQAAWFIDDIALHLRRLENIGGRRLVVSFSDTGHDDHVAAHVAAKELAHERGWPLLTFSLPEFNGPSVIYENSHDAEEYALQYPSQFGHNLEHLDEQHLLLLHRNSFERS